MNPVADIASSNDGYDISIVMTAYNEEEIIGYTIPRLLAAFDRAGHRLELVAVDNGSSDRTGEIISRFAAQTGAVVHHRVEKNQGYGNGVLSGIPLCTAPWVGVIPADGQVDAEDVVHLYEAVAASNGRVLGKARRRFRMDGFDRRIITTLYNLYVLLLWPRLGSLDVNGNPKILPGEAIRAMELKSKGWLLDPEIMVKARYMGLKVIEYNVFDRIRASGVSHVKPGTCWEFFWNLLIFRLSGKWIKDLKDHSGAANIETHPVFSPLTGYRD